VILSAFVTAEPVQYGTFMSQPLSGRRIVVPESRELDLFVQMLERAGAQAIRCPLVSIHDVEDAGPVEAWIRRLSAGEQDDLVLYTGEGVKRLHAVAVRAGIEADYVEGLRRTRKIVRGPKPTRVLRTLGLAPEIAAEVPTTEGLIAILSGLDLAGRRVGVQLYPNHNDAILAHLRGAGASVDPVVPYRYASEEEDGRVIEVLHAMAAGEIDTIALTSTPQVRRLKEVATKHGIADILHTAAERTLIAAVGPVTAEAARTAGWHVAVMPETSFHLKPFITAMAEARSRPEGRRESDVQGRGGPALVGWPPDR
jgi:uroporphyrinogen-III synthase